MEKQVTDKMCVALMKEFEARKDSFGNVGYPKNADFLHELQVDASKWKTVDFLSAKGYISLTLDAGRALINIHVEESGVTYFADRADAIKERRRGARRYWITTAIAMTALVKSFMPEICAGVAWLWSKLVQ